MNILVTGGSSDVAHAIVSWAIARNNNVVITASTQDSLDLTLSKYREQGLAVDGFVLDFAHPELCTADLARFADGFDAVILNAFERLPTLKRLHEIDFEKASSYIHRQISGNLWLIQKILPHMTEQKFGRIILISSVSAAVGTSKYGIYCAAKAALEGLILNVAVDYGAEQILANVLRLGLFKTKRTRMFWREDSYVERVGKLIPQGKMGESNQVAEMLEPLLSRTSYVNGAIIPVSGGLPLTAMF